MSANTPSLHIGVYGSDEKVGQQSRGCSLWAPGYAATITAAGGSPVPLHLRPGCSWDELLEGVDGVVFAGSKATNGQQQAEEERLCEWCRELGIPLLAVDQGLHILNGVYGGATYQDLPRELPEALQHRHPLEEGLRHAIEVTPGTRMAEIYGDGEIIVNSEHRQAVSKVAKGFKISARALDGVVEAIETETDDWYAIGVQWHPASATASGLDIQLFRGLLEASAQRRQQSVHAPVGMAA